LTNPFSAVSFNVDVFRTPSVKVVPFNHLKLGQQSESEGSLKFTEENKEDSDTNVGDIITCIKMEE
tara:strand:+ start:330 stop:527 length:198 start_codon:yes stop_codon:yes gene_type:complete